MKILSNLFLAKAILFIVLIPTFFCAAQNSSSLRIITPHQDAEVRMTVMVRGKTTILNQQIQILVHPMSANMWWVQTPPRGINMDSTWQTLCYCGTKIAGIDEFYEIVAIITHENLIIGQTLEEIPEKSIRSDIITVHRNE
jgi:hypothetical protein